MLLPFKKEFSLSPLHTFLSPPFHSDLPKSDLCLLFSFLRVPFPLNLGSLSHTPRWLYCPPVVSLPHVLPSIVLALPPSGRALSSLGSPLTSAPRLPGGACLVYSPLDVCASPDFGRGLCSAPSPWAAVSTLQPHSLIPCNWIPCLLLASSDPPSLLETLLWTQPPLPLFLQSESCCARSPPEHSWRPCSLCTPITLEAKSPSPPPSWLLGSHLASSVLPSGSTSCCAQV